jgi:hypothetical protein
MQPINLLGARMLTLSAGSSFSSNNVDKILFYLLQFKSVCSKSNIVDHNLIKLIRKH